ncbi:MAG: phage Gp37/Gp68 family protein [Rickettsiales bacterium]
MSRKSQIEWTEFTWNPTTGCTKISAGCKNCYAEIMAVRLQAMGVAGYEEGFKLKLLPDRLKQPLERKKPTTYFVNSMSDLFHSDIPNEYLDKIFAIINKTPQHTYQILTKRPENMKKYFMDRFVPRNAWLGVSVEDKKHGIPRIDILRGIKSRIRFLSVEPLLEDIGDINLSGIHWVIVGGESGIKARPMKEEWVENIQKQCALYNTSFFFKQWGTWGTDGIKRAKSSNGRLFKGRTWENMPNNPNEQLELL